MHPGSHCFSVNAEDSDLYWWKTSKPLFQYENRNNQISEAVHDIVPLRLFYSAACLLDLAVIFF